MMNLLIKSCLFLAVILVAGSFSGKEGFVQPAFAQQTTQMGFAGDFSGRIYLEGQNGMTEAGLRVTSLGENEYRAVLYPGGLPENGESGGEAIEWRGSYEDYTLRLTGDLPVILQFIHGRYTALDEENNYMGHFDRVIRVSPGS